VVAFAVAVRTSRVGRQWIALARRTGFTLVGISPMKIPVPAHELQHAAMDRAEFIALFLVNGCGVRSA
jgi:hypothetical protein